MCSDQKKVGGLCLSAALLQQTAELQANKPHYHHHHQQQISLQQLSAVHITDLTAQTPTSPDGSALELNETLHLEPNSIQLKKKHLDFTHLVFQSHVQSRNLTLSI